MLNKMLAKEDIKAGKVIPIYQFKDHTISGRIVEVFDKSISILRMLFNPLGSNLIVVEKYKLVHNNSINRPLYGLVLDTSEGSKRIIDSNQDIYLTYGLQLKESGLWNTREPAHKR